LHLTAESASDSGAAATEPDARIDLVSPDRAPFGRVSNVASPSQAVLPDGRVILNLAGEDDLRRLPGIGPTRARAILALRQHLAKFRAVEDLLRVRGIGRKILQRIRPAVVIDRPAGVPAMEPPKPP
jgi:competence protein ComEA